MYPKDGSKKIGLKTVQKGAKSLNNPKRFKIAQNVRKHQNDRFFEKHFHAAAVAWRQQPRPPTVQNTQAPSDFLTLPQFIPTCYKCYKRKKTFITLLRVDLSLKTSCWVYWVNFFDPWRNIIWSITKMFLIHRRFWDFEIYNGRTSKFWS